LSQRREIDTKLGNAEFGILCLKHLTSKPFESFDNDQILSYAMRGYFALQDYAVQHWYGHLLEWARLADLSAAQTLARLGGQFLQSYGLASKLGRHFDETMTPAELSALIHVLPEDDSKRNSYFTIERRTLIIRSCIEMLKNEQLEPASHEVLDGLYGPWKTCKCSKSWCFFFTEGMETTEKRQKHTARHDLPFRCHLEDCFAYSLGFDSLPSLSRHKQNYHDTSKEEPVKFPLIALKEPLTLWEAAKKGDIKMVEAILDTGVDVNQTKPRSRYTDALSLAAKHDRMEICQLLIDRGATCHSNGNSHYMLEAAVDNRNLALLTLFLAQLKTRDARYSVSRGILRHAIDLGDRAVLKTLLQSGDITAERGEVLHAIDRKTQAMLEELIAHKEYQALLDQNLVEAAVRTGLANMVDILLSTGRPQITDNDPIITALRDKRPLIAETILRYRNLRLMDDHLQECGKLGCEMGFEDVVAVINKLKGFRRKWPLFDFLGQARLCS
jgi:hypothetical protein